MLRIGAPRRLDRCRNFGCWPFATFRCLVAVGGVADIGTPWRPEGSVACDPQETLLVSTALVRGHETSF